MSSAQSELKEALLAARAELKKLFTDVLDKSSADWPVDTTKYRFYRLGEDQIPQPNYGFGVYLKRTAQYGLWYRDTLEPQRPLKIFRSNRTFTLREPL
jgi:hypothetical protein